MWLVNCDIGPRPGTKRCLCAWRQQEDSGYTRIGDALPRPTAVERGESAAGAWQEGCAASATDG